FSWRSQKNFLGKDTIRLTESIPNRVIQFQMLIHGFPPSHGSFDLSPTLSGRGTWIKWTINIRVGWWPWWKYFGAMMDKMVGPTIETGLSNLKSRCENAKVFGIQIIDTTTQERFVASYSKFSSKGNKRKVVAQMLLKIRKFIRFRGLKIDGNPMAQFLNIENRGVQIHAGIPVNKYVPGALGIQVLRMPHGNVLEAKYLGAYSGISTAYEALTSYAYKHHKVSPAGPWEEYISGSSNQGDSSKSETLVFFPIF
ncbi:MAG: hypothetical protein ACYCOO_11870, partial [Chitinophagaceae bacterium]